MKKRKTEWFWTRLSAILMIGDGLCLLIFGRYWAWDLKFTAWDIERQLIKRIKEKGN